MATRKHAQKPIDELTDELYGGNDNSMHDTTHPQSVASNAPLKDDPADDLPDELSDDDELTYEPPESVGLSLDELNDLETDRTLDEVERAKLDAPGGNWEKKAVWEQEVNGKMEANFRTRLDREDRKHGDIKEGGRLYISVWGKPEKRIVNGITYYPTMYINMSPDRRTKENTEGEQVADFAYQTWLRAADLYMSLYGKTGKPGDITRMLIEDHYIISTFKGDRGPQVMGFQDPDRQRARMNRQQRVRR